MKLFGVFMTCVILAILIRSADEDVRGVHLKEDEGAPRPKAERKGSVKSLIEFVLFYRLLVCRNGWSTTRRSGTCLRSSSGLRYVDRAVRV